MIKRSIARRYAQALMDLVKDDAVSVAGQLQAFAEVLRANPVLMEVFVSPAFRLEERKKIFGLILKRLGWGSPLDRYLWYLIEHRRMAWLEAIAESFLAMVDERQGRIRIQVTSAKKLNKATQEKLLKTLKGGMGSNVVLEPHVDESLLAGLSVRIGDLVIDGSLRTQLNSLREALLQPSGFAKG